MSRLTPVPSQYRPTFPRELTEQQIRELLRPGLFERFSKETLATGALLTGLTLAGCDNRGAGEEPVPQQPDKPTVESIDEVASPQEQYKPSVKSVDEIPKVPAPISSGKTTSSDPNLKKKVDQLVAEVLGNSRKGYWNDLASIRLSRDLKANPPIKYPSIPISFGNSYIGIFDINEAKRATHQLFAAYGIELKSDVPIKRDGYQFNADGFNSDLRAGFEFVVPEGGIGFGSQVLPAQAADAKLDEKEKAALDRDLEAGKLRLFVVNAEGFPNMDGDLYTPMEYYLASVVDYLNWVHGDRQIDTSKLLGKLPATTRIKQEQVNSWRAQHPALPGCTFEDADDIEKHWTVEKGTLERSKEWSGNLEHRWSEAQSTSTGRWSLHVKLEPSGSICYTVPDDRPVFLKQTNVAFGCHLIAYESGVRIMLKGENGATWEFDVPPSYAPVVDKREKAPFKKLKTITITLKGDKAASIYLDDLGVQHEIGL